MLENIQSSINADNNAHTAPKITGPDPNLKLFRRQTEQTRSKHSHAAMQPPRSATSHNNPSPPAHAHSEHLLNAAVAGRMRNPIPSPHHQPGRCAGTCACRTGRRAERRFLFRVSSRVYCKKLQRCLRAAREISFLQREKKKSRVNHPSPAYPSCPRLQLPRVCSRDSVQRAEERLRGGVPSDSASLWELGDVWA